MLGANKNKLPKGNRKDYGKQKCVSERTLAWAAPRKPREREIVEPVDDCKSEMSGLSYFAIRIQSWILKTQSKSTVQNIFQMWSPSPNDVQNNWKNAVFSQQKCFIYFPSTQSNSGPLPELRSDLTYSPDPIQIQQNLLWSGSSPIQVQSKAHLCCKCHGQVQKLLKYAD